MKNIIINDQICDIGSGTVSLPIKISTLAHGKFTITRGQSTESGFALRDGKVLWVFLRGQSFKVTMPDAARKSAGTSKADSGEGQGIIISPMPAKVFKLPVTSGAKVQKGQTLVVLEAMKMEHSLIAPFDGTVRFANLKEGDRVEHGQVLMEVDHQ